MSTTALLVTILILNILLIIIFGVVLWMFMREKDKFMATFSFVLQALLGDNAINQLKASQKIPIT